MPDGECNNADGPISAAPWQKMNAGRNRATIPKMVDSARRIEELRRELAANPTSRQFYQLGELLRREGRASEAAGVLRSGLAHHPRYVAAWVALGRACIDAGTSDEAATALREALALDAANPVAWRLLGEAHLALGDRRAALEVMQ